MQEAGVEPNTVVYNSALDACGRAGKPKVAEKLLRKMGETGDHKTIREENSLLRKFRVESLCCRCGGVISWLESRRWLWRAMVVHQVYKRVVFVWLRHSDPATTVRPGVIAPPLDRL